MQTHNLRQRHLRHLITLVGACVSTGLAAQTAAPANIDNKTDSASSDDEEIVFLSPFEITAERNAGYFATETLAGTRIRTDLKDVATSISVVTKEFMDDIGATDNTTLLQYLGNTEVGGTHGTYFGGGNGTTIYDGTSITGNNRVRGLSSADGTRDYFLSNIPWDSYNVDRIDVQRGPNAILFGLGSPAGIINATTRNAQYTNSGSAQARYGSYGSVRGTLDVNRTLIDNVLAVRIDGLWSNQKYQQKPAFKDDKRVYGTVRWDPKLFSPEFATSIKAKFESGKINANMPHTTTPYDQVTTWFDSGKYTVGGTGNDNIYGIGDSIGNDWCTYGLNQQTAGYFIEGNSGLITNVYAGYIKNGFLNNNGTKKGNSEMAIGQYNPWPLITTTSYSSYASNAGLTNAKYGIYKNKMLTDSSIFNFYDNLIDGDNKRETANWTAYNLDFTQNGWGDRVALNIVYNYEKYDTDNWSTLGSAPTISVDVTKVMQDNSVNPNYGRAYIGAGTGSGNWSTTEREGVRASLFGELRTSDFTQNDFLVKLIGTHRFNVVASRDTYHTESRDYALYAKTAEWDALARSTTTPNTTNFDDRSPQTLIYLGSSLANATSAAGANIPRITSDIRLKDSYVYLFDSTWTATGVDPSSAWTPTTAYEKQMFNSALATTQASNLANYTGWTRKYYLDLLSYWDGDDLYTGASKTEKVITSYASSWQGFMWNDAIVPTVGWRYDSVKSRSKTASRDTTNRGYLKLDETNYSLPDYTASSYYRGHSLSGGAVVHINKLLPLSWDKHVPLNLSLTYNDSSNFQVSSARCDVYGNPISNPTGKTKDFGVLLSTKDDRFSLRVVKYSTRVQDATVSTSSGFMTSIRYGVWWNNIFRYQLGGYTLDTRVKATDTGNQAVWNGQTVTYNTRWYWTPEYMKDGLPVQTKYYSLYANQGESQTLPAYDYLETDAQSIAHRDACMDSWAEIAKWLEAKGLFKAWNWNIVSTDKWVNRSVYEKSASVNASGYLVSSTYEPDSGQVNQDGGTTPSGYAITGDQDSKGYEFELTANITKNWRVAFNASKTTAITTQIGDDNLLELIAYMDEKMAGVAGDLRRWNGDDRMGETKDLRDEWTNFKGDWALLTLTQYTSASELRKWHYNIVTNYTFDQGWLKDVGVGGAYRWQDKVVIGYPFVLKDGTTPTYDTTNPVYGPTEDGFDFWLSYSKDLNDKVNWKIQLNVSNVLEKNGLIPISVEPDGTTWAGVRMKPVQEWSITNTFTF
jgi:outer membrane receptor protein involved in Fe transport